MFAKKLAREKWIPSDPFYSEENIARLKESIN
ncbi:MAG: hypothetical protein WDA17_03205 [Sphaerochaetaceae bacterium]